MDRAKIELSGNTLELFFLEPKVKNREEVWVGPSITVTWLKVDGDLLEEQKRLRGKIRQHLEGQGASVGLAKSLKKGKAKGVLNVAWDQSGGKPGPHLVGKDKVKDWFIGQAIIVVEK